MSGNAKPFELPQLLYDENALEPTISSKTIGFHYGKHHAAYFNMLNTLVVGTDFSDMTLDEVVQKSFGKADSQKIFNNAAQAWNHNIYWEEMRPDGNGTPSGRLAELIDSSFGSFNEFKDQIVQTAVGIFGSGWAWLVKENDSLTITGLPNAENPLAHDKKALMVIDVWEHAYYLDYQNRRADHIRAVLDNLINWDYVADRL